MAHTPRRKRGIATTLLMSMFLFSFRACYNKYCAPSNVSQEGINLEKLYSSLNRRQQKLLLKIVGKLSEKDQKKLSDLFSSISPEDIASLKKLLHEFSKDGQSSSTKLLKSMIMVLLRHDYKPEELTHLIKALGTQDYQDESTQEFLTEVFTEVSKAEDTTEVDSSLTSMPEEAPDIDAWEDKIKSFELAEDAKNKLLVTLKQLQKEPDYQQVSASLYALLEKTPLDRNQRLLKGITKFENEDRITLLRAIATLKARNSELMEKICKGKGLAGKMESIGLIASLDSASKKLMWKLWWKL